MPLRTRQATQALLSSHRFRCQQHQKQLTSRTALILHLRIAQYQSRSSQPIKKQAHRRGATPLILLRMASQAALKPVRQIKSSKCKECLALLMLFLLHKFRSLVARTLQGLSWSTEEQLVLEASFYSHPSNQSMRRSSAFAGSLRRAL